MLNKSHDMLAFEARISQTALAVARGKDAFADLALSFTNLMVLDPSAEAGMAKAVYSDLRGQAERKAADAGKPLKPQTDKSFASQVSKLTVFGELGELARKNHAAADVLGEALPLCEGKYTPFVDVARALRKYLRVVPAASKADLRVVVQGALPEPAAPETDADKVRAVHKRLAKLGVDPEEGDVAMLTPYAERDPRIATAITAALTHLSQIADMVAAIEAQIEADRKAEAAADEE